MQKLLISLMGPPGSGKGTSAKMCEERLGMATLSTGDLCRRHIAEETELGKKIEAITTTGSLIPDSWVTEMVIEWFRDTWPRSNGVILDGYPRTEGQAESFAKFLKLEGLENNFVVVMLEVPDEVLVSRLANRLLCSSQDCQAVYSLLAYTPRVEGLCDQCGAELIRRDDDSEETVRDRLAVYECHKKELEAAFQHLGCRIERIPVSNQTVPQVFAELKRRVGVSAQQGKA
jgi:adenylate kinase